jgi:hypothetical protein
MGGISLFKVAARPERTSHCLTRPAVRLLQVKRSKFTFIVHHHANIAVEADEYGRRAGKKWKLQLYVRSDIIISEVILSSDERSTSL